MNSSTLTAEPGTATIKLVVLDMAGTTLDDDGMVERAFAITAERAGLDRYRPLEEALDYVRATMGQSKIEVFRFLTNDDEASAQAANVIFEQAYAEVAAVGVPEIPGAGETIARLQAAGVAVYLTTGFSPVTRDALLAPLDWQIDGVFSPADVGGRGRPQPDMILAAMAAAGIEDPSQVAIAGDTSSDIAAGLNAQVGLTVGVLSGAHDEDQLRSAGADEVVENIAAIPALLGL